MEGMTFSSFSKEIYGDNDFLLGMWPTLIKVQKRLLLKAGKVGGRDGALP